MLQEAMIQCRYKELHPNSFTTKSCPQKWANTQVMLAADGEIVNGKYYDEYGRVKKLAPFAQDQTKARELWQVSESLSQCLFNVE